MASELSTRHIDDDRDYVGPRPAFISIKGLGKKLTKQAVETSNPPRYDLESVCNAQVYCAAINGYSGLRCSNTTKNGEMFCWAHLKRKNAVSMSKYSDLVTGTLKDAFISAQQISTLDLTGEVELLRAQIIHQIKIWDLASQRGESFTGACTVIMENIRDTVESVRRTVETMRRMELMEAISPGVLATVVANISNLVQEHLPPDKAELFQQKLEKLPWPGRISYSTSHKMLTAEDVSGPAAGFENADYERVVQEAITEGKANDTVFGDIPEDILS